jgi:hypothetical protein
MGEPMILAMGAYSYVFPNFIGHYMCDLGLLNCLRALGGYTKPRSAQTIFDTDSFVESEYLQEIYKTSGNVPLALNWYSFTDARYYYFYSQFSCRYNSFKVGRSPEPYHFYQ